MLSSRRQRGITLMELLITLSVIAIVVAIGSPALSTTVRRIAVDTELNQLQTMVNFARAKAVAQNTTVSICRSSDGSSCALSGSLGDWSAGWLVFTDSGVAGVVDGNDAVLRVRNQVADRVAVNALDVSAVAIGRHFVQFDRLGAPTSVTGAASQAVFTFCDDSANAATAKGIYVNALGRPARTRDLNGNGVEEWQLGSDLSC